MKDKRATRGEWLRKLQIWWFLFKGDVDQIVWCEAPSADVWRAMNEIVEAFQETLDADDAEALNDDHSKAGLVGSVRLLSEYLDDVSNGPLLETRLGRRLFDVSKGRRFGGETVQSQKEVA